jgi:hypothetical protein
MGYKKTKQLGKQLSPIMQNFIDLYFANNENPTKTYLAVCEKMGRKVTTASAAVLGSQLIKDDRIQKELTAQRDVANAKYNITRERVIQEILDVIQSSRDNGDRRNWNEAIKTLAKVTGFDVPGQTNIIQNSGGDIQITFGGWNPEVKQIETKNIEAEEITNDEVEFGNNE